MSSPDSKFRPERRAVLRLGLAAGLAVPLAACFRPVYSEQGYATSPSAKGDAPVSVNLKSIDVTAIDGRIGGKMRNELIFMLRGGSAPGPIAYRLDVRMTVRTQSPVVDPFTNVADIQSVSLTADYVLKPAGRLDPLLSEQTFATASFETGLQRFADIRARRDAEDRAATQIAEKIRTRLQAYFAAGR